MKIAEYAKFQNCSRQAVYAKLSKNGYKVGELTDKKGQLTKRGIKILDSVYSAVQASNENADDKNQKHLDQDFQSIIKEKQNLIDVLTKQLEEVTTDRDAWRKQALHHAERIDSLEQKLEKLSFVFCSSSAVNVPCSEKICDI